MKLIVCVVTDKDSHNLLDQLVNEGYRATKLASTGGFLKEGNTTLLIGVEDEMVDKAISIIEENCKVRKQMMTPIPPLPDPAEAYLTYPVEVNTGGATLFVLDVEKYLKV